MNLFIKDQTKGGNTRSTTGSLLSIGQIKMNPAKSIDAY